MVIQGIWAKKTVTGKEFDEFYKHLDTYTLMGKEGEGRTQKHIVAFLTTEDNLREALNKGKDIQRIMSREELMKIQNNRKANNIYPRPFPGRDEVLEEILESPEPQPEPQQQSFLKEEIDYSAMTEEEIEMSKRASEMLAEIRKKDDDDYLDIPF